MRKEKTQKNIDTAKGIKIELSTYDTSTKLARQKHTRTEEANSTTQLIGKKWNGDRKSL